MIKPLQQRDLAIQAVNAVSTLAKDGRYYPESIPFPPVPIHKPDTEKPVLAQNNKQPASVETTEIHWFGERYKTDTDIQEPQKQESVSKDNEKPNIATDTKSEVVDIAKLEEENLPPALKGIKKYTTENNNYDEAQELINSLLVQMELLEREKEALREMVPEKPTPVSLIRNCQKEQTLILDLKERLDREKNDKFLLKQELDGFRRSGKL